MKTLSDWFIIQLNHQHVCARFQDGGHVITDQILNIIGKYVITMNRIYVLGTPDKLWLSSLDGDEKLKHYDYYSHVQ